MLQLPKFSLFCKLLLQSSRALYSTKDTLLKATNFSSYSYMIGLRFLIKNQIIGFQMYFTCLKAFNIHKLRKYTLSTLIFTIKI